VWDVDLRARGIAVGLVFLACVFIMLWVVIGENVHKNYETPTPVRNSTLFFPIFSSRSHSSGQYWCWISPQYPGDRLGGESVWLWIALVVSAILYIPLYFWAEGFWSVNEENKFHWSNPDQRVRYEERRSALGMLL
jgi:hypothetical protein